jgi:DNA (cytosine-5)-methyltransferase 1
MNIEEISAQLGVSQKQLRKLVASGSIAYTKEGTSYNIDKKDLKKVRKAILDGSLIQQTKESKQTERFDGVEKQEREVNWTDISREWERPVRSNLTFVDLFCGAGGLSKGFEMAGLHGICGLDWFDEAGMTYRRNFDHPFVNGDIKSAEKKKEFYETVRKQLKGRQLDIVAGGFPCQGFSMAGNRIVDDPRNSLYLELVEIVRTLQPNYVVCENVKGLRSMLNGKVEQKILDDFRAIGYEMNVATLCAADYTTPQKRERVIFIGNRLGLQNLHPKAILDPEHYVTTGQAIADLMNHPEDPAFNHVPTKHRPDMAQRMQDLAEGESLYAGYSDAWKKCPWNEASCTIKENHGGVNIHPRLPRVLTAREMARLQSFPDDFIFEGPKNKQLVQIGNAVPPYLGKAIGLAIKAMNRNRRRNA